MKTPIQRAFDLAYELEPERYRIASPLPNGKELYWTHLYSVYKICIYWGKSDEATLVAAILHDIVEDTTYALSDVQENFGLQVSQIVDLCTKKKGYKTFDANDMEEYFSRMQACKEEFVRQSVLTIKLADRIDNLAGASFFADEKAKLNYYNETKQYYLPIAKELRREGELNNLLRYFENKALSR